MSPRKVLFQLHWIFGITVGIVLAIVGATGALLSFEQQIVASVARDARQVAANGRTPLPPAELLTRVAVNAPAKRITGLSKGNLSSHLSRLADGDLVTIEKDVVENVPNTRIGLTRSGRAAIERHWQRLDKLRRASLEWSPGTVS